MKNGEFTICFHQKDQEIQFKSCSPEEISDWTSYSDTRLSCSFRSGKRSQSSLLNFLDWEIWYSWSCWAQAPYNSCSSSLYLLSLSEEWHFQRRGKRTQNRIGRSQVWGEEGGYSSVLISVMVCLYMTSSLGIFNHYTSGTTPFQLGHLLSTRKIRCCMAAKVNCYLRIRWGLDEWLQVTCISSHSFCVLY